MAAAAARKLNMAQRSPLLESLAEPSKRAILEQLKAGPKSVGELVSLTGLSQPNVSNHLARLRAADVVSVRQNGRQRVYDLTSGISQAALLAPSSVSPTPLSPRQLKDLSGRLFTALIEGDQRGAWRVVYECISSHPSVIPLYVDVMAPAMEKIGDWYENGRISEADEHLATSVIERLMAYAATAVPTPAWNGRRAIAGAVAGNYHVVGLRMLADALQELGWEVRYLGADVPAASFVRMVRAERPDLVVVSASVRAQAEAAVELGASLGILKQEGHTFTLAVGGAASRYRADLAEQSQADLSAPDLESFIAAVRKRFES